MIGIIDYGMGNLRSVEKAFRFLDAPVRILTQPGDLESCERVVLPGVGAFRDAIHELRRLEFDQALKDFADSGQPLLGICLGLQLFFDVSYEDGEYEGLQFLPGEVVRFEPEPGLKIPQMGWNSLTIKKRIPLLAGLESGDSVYFVHSYHARPSRAEDAAATATHGSQEFLAVAARGNVMATQFHPEKSQQVGLRILKNFATLDVPTLTTARSSS